MINVITIFYVTRSRVPFLWNENHSKEYAPLKEMLCKQIVIADNLSRRYSKEKTKLETEKIETFVCMTSNDQELQIVRKYIQEGWPENKNNVNELAKPYWSFKELSTSNGLILKNFCIVIPKNCRKHVLQQIHYPHLGIEKTKAFARQVIFWPGLNKHIEDMVSN
ncbi:hypothetical protein TKK_0015282 [Trichogramma kaykai]